MYLATITDFIESVLDYGGQVGVICTDFDKAFDTVNRKVLLRKLII